MTSSFGNLDAGSDGLLVPLVLVVVPILVFAGREAEGGGPLLESNVTNRFRKMGN
jgi:hypothetical protein